MKRDPIEKTQEFIEVLARIQPQLDEINTELDERGLNMGRCHIYWERKKKLLKSQGIDWKMVIGHTVFLSIEKT